MAFLVVSFIAGVLTVLAPCILPLLPVVVGSALTPGRADGQATSGRSKWTPYVVVGSLSFSVITFTYLLKASTVFIMVPPQFWSWLSGGILGAFGLTLLFPGVWERIPGLAWLQSSSNQLMGKGYQEKSLWGDVLIGAALGPIFASCSPTYFVILASVLPVSYALGTAYLLAYVLGLALVLLLIALLGQRFADSLTGFSDPRGLLKRSIGALFILVGLLIVSGYDKKFQIAILDSGYFDITKVEQLLLQRVQ